VCEARSIGFDPVYTVCKSREALYFQDYTDFIIIVGQIWSVERATRSGGTHWHE
jgi:hypothetical protein